MIKAQLAGLGILPFVLLGVPVAANPGDPALNRTATSQPADDRTMIQFMIVEFSPKSTATTARDIRRQIVASANESPWYGLKTLQKIGTVEVLHRPAIVVTWPQPSEIILRERVPTVTGVILNKHPDDGFKLSIEGQWLNEVDPTRAYVRLNVDHSYVPNQGKNTSSADPEVHVTKRKERIVGEGTSSWFILPRPAETPEKPFILISLTLHHPLCVPTKATP